MCALLLRCGARAASLELPRCHLFSPCNFSQVWVWRGHPVIILILVLRGEFYLILHLNLCGLHGPRAGCLCWSWSVCWVSVAGAPIDHFKRRFRSRSLMESVVPNDDGPAHLRPSAHELWSFSTRIAGCESLSVSSCVYFEKYFNLK
jgi:hypothetical protein